MNDAAKDRQPNLENLRMALAVNRGMELLDTIATEVNTSTIEHHESKREGFLVPLFERIHRELFRDWQKQPGTHEPGDILNAKVRGQLRGAIRNHLLSNGNGNGDMKLFDANGFIIGSEKDLKDRKDHCAKVLAEFYDALRNIHAFDYGNELTRDFFIVALGKLPAFQEVFGTDIDLRRLNKDEARELHKKGSSLESLQGAFRHALDPTPLLRNKANGYDPWQKHVEDIAHIRFLSHTDETGKKYLVTINGGLVPFDDELKKDLEKKLISDELFADITPITRDKIVGYLPGTESLREGYDSKGEKYIDGFRTTQNEAPLFCLDVNILTGLLSTSDQKLMNMIAQCRGKNTPIFSLANNDGLKGDLDRLVGDDQRLKRTVETAHAHITLMTQKMDALKADIFKDKHPVKDPVLFVSMGGAASGKSNVEKIARAACNENVVVASLDEFREKSDLHKVLKAANHHADDYTIIEPFANALREWVASHARNANEGRYNLLFDGTAIPYQPRYAVDIIDQFKTKGFTTQVIAFDREYRDAVDHVKKRARKENRGVPWAVVAGKHSRMSRAMLQAIEDAQVDKFSLYANDGRKGEHRLIAETLSESAGLPQPNHHAKLSYTIKGKSRQLAIYDADRFTRVLDKGLINPFASDPNNVDTPSRSLAFLPGTPTWGRGS